MTLKKAIGYVLVSSPFIGIFGLVCYEAGILEAIGLFAAIGLVVGVLTLGQGLIDSDN